MMSPSHELLIKTEPSDVAFLPTRMVEHAKHSRGVQASDPISPIRTMNLLYLLLILITFITVLLQGLKK
jgi:hypothetical protein